MLKRGLVASYFGQAWVGVVGIIFIPTYIKELGPESWGLIAFMGVMQSWLALLDAGLSPALEREMARFYSGSHAEDGSILSLLRSVEIVYSGLAIFIVSLIWISAPWIESYWLKFDQSSLYVINAIRVMGIVIATRMIEQVYRGALVGLHKQVSLNFIQAASATIRWGGGVALIVFFGVEIEGFLYWLCFISVLTILFLAKEVYGYKEWNYKDVEIGVSPLIKIKNYAGGLVMVTTLSLFITSFDKILITKFCTLEDFGYYSAAISAAGTLYFLIVPIYTVILPKFVQMVESSNEAEIEYLYFRICEVSSFILVPISAVMIVFSEQILFVWSGDNNFVENISLLLKFLAAGNMIHGLMYIPYAMQLAHGRTDIAIRVNVIIAFLCIPLYWFSIFQYGVVGSSIVWLVLNIFSLLLGMKVMHNSFLFISRSKWMLESVIKPIVISFFCCLIAHLAFNISDVRIYAGIELALISIISIGVTTILNKNYRILVFKAINEKTHYIDSK